MRAWGRLAASLALAVAAATLPATARADVSETDVKAAFLPRFARYVTWPTFARPGPGQPFVLCVAGSDPFGGALDKAAAGQSVDGRRVLVRRLNAPTGNGCHIAFVQGSRTVPTAQMLAGFDGRPVLTVTDARSGPQRGIVHFAVVGGRVRFYIDERQAAARGLTINSRLLALAVGVKPR